MNKRILVFLLIWLFLLTNVGGVLAVPVVVMDSKQLAFGSPPVIVSGRVLVPMRQMFEALGATVEWNEGIQTIVAKRITRTFTLKIGEQNIIDRDNSTIHSDVPPMIIDNKTYVPLRVVSELLKADVNWDNANQVVTIVSNYGTVQYSDGLYEGEVLNSLPSGEGVLAFNDQGIYAGGMLSGLMEGYGIYRDKEGNEYLGLFKQGQFNGFGILTFADGSKMEGQWEQGKYVAETDGNNAKESPIPESTPLEQSETYETTATSDTPLYVVPDTKEAQRPAYGDETLMKTGPGTGLYDYSATFGKGAYAPFAPGTKTLAARQFEAGLSQISIGAASTLSGNVIESAIDGTFKGWDGDTIFKLRNGQIWQQSSYNYVYHYAYSPKVLIYKSGIGFKMHVDGVSKDISVKRLK